jgi:TRAP-type mannitol/chloroaromatic compound transport system permease small subunit
MAVLEPPGIDDFSPSGGTLVLRWFCWTIVVCLFAFLVNVYLNYWLGWPGTPTLFARTGLDPSQIVLYGLAVVIPLGLVLTTRRRSLRRDSLAMGAIAAYIVRAAFWTVFLVGIADTAISFLRVEGLLPALIGQGLTEDLGRSRFRGPYVHLPLIALSLVISAFSRTLGFTWLALLVVVAEFAIVIARFVFSYEQAFMGDLVRFWYGGLFLFSSAYTLLEDGHVRVDVLYAGFQDRTKGMVNALGALLLGIPLCWVVLAVGFGQRSSIITNPLLSIEVSQSGFGMYVKYLLAAFLAIFAITMMIQFAAYILEGVADIRGDPGKRRAAPAAAH